MKTLIQESIFVNRLGKGPNAITIFNRKSLSDKDLSKYIDLSILSGKIAEIDYSYLEDGIEKKDSITTPITEGLTEVEVKNLILSKIQIKLNSVE